MTNEIFVEDRSQHIIKKEHRIAFIKDPLLAVEYLFPFKLS